MAWYDDDASNSIQIGYDVFDIDPRDFTKEEVRRAHIYAMNNQDSIRSYLSSLNSQVRTIKWFVGIGVTFYIVNLPFWQNI